MFALDATRELVGATTVVQAVVLEALKFALDATRADLEEFAKGASI
jgi:hypothetical protein